MANGPSTTNMMNGTSIDTRPALGVHKPRTNGYHSSSSPERSSHSDYNMDSSASSLPFGSRSGSNKGAASSASRAYKEAANYFLTRQMAESLAILRPALSDAADRSTPRATRVKVWSLYFAIFDAAVKMSPDEGKRIWGGQDWRRIVGRVRNGLIWEEVVEAYGGEGNIDADVVIALVMLVLAHGNDQTITQKRIEAFLAESPAVNEGPRALAQRVKLMELYILHVLPRVDEWDYAREFTQMSEYLDAEKKESFLSALENLQAEKAEAEARRLQEERLQAEALDREQRLADERNRLEAATAAENRSRSTQRALTRSNSVSGAKNRRRSTARSTASSDRRPLSRRGSRGRQGHANDSGDDALSTASSAYGRKHASILTQTSDLANNMVRWMNASMGGQKVVQAAVVGAAMLMALAKKNTRARLWRYLVLAWFKMLNTVGMGMKVTYI